MFDVSKKRLRIGILLVVTFAFLMCLSISSGHDLYGTDMTQREIGRTSSNATRHRNEPENSTAGTRAGRTDSTQRGDNSPPHPQHSSSPTGERQKTSRSAEDRQMEALMVNMFEDHLLANLDFETLARPVNYSLPPVPDYMFRLYEHLKVDTSRFKTHDTTYSEYTNDIFDETIRGYHLISENWRGPGRGFLVFNTTYQPMKENITHVELVLYMCPHSGIWQTPRNRQNTGKSEDSSPAGTSQYVNVTVTMASKRRRRHNRIHLRLPVDSNRSCLPINITKMVQRSFAQRQTILNFSIETSSLADQSALQPCQLGRRQEEKRPLLVIYENVLPFVENRDYTTFRRKRRASKRRNAAAATTTTDPPPTDTTTPPSFDIRAKLRSIDPAENSTSDSVSASTPGPTFPSSTNADIDSTVSPSNSTPYPATCHLRRWYVSFADMQWHHVILNPPGYYANYCWGLCPAFLDNVNSTNHAFIRSKFMLLQRLDPDIPRPFCSPIRMTPLTLLYYSKYNVTITKRFNEMVAAECSCM